MRRGFFGISQRSSQSDAQGEERAEKLRTNLLRCGLVNCLVTQQHWKRLEVEVWSVSFDEFCYNLLLHFGIKSRFNMIQSVSPIPAICFQAKRQQRLLCGALCVCVCVSAGSFGLKLKCNAEIVMSKVTRMDGRELGDFVPESFDAILLDAPCSCEGNVRKVRFLLV